MLRKPSNMMRGKTIGHDFVDPIIMRILKDSTVLMSTLAINYRVNERAGKTVNLNVIRNHLLFLAKNKKISESFNEDNGVTYYKLVL